MGKYDRYLTIFMVFLSSFYYFQIRKLPAEAGKYPKFVLGLLLLFTVILGIQSFFMKDKGEKKQLFKGFLPKQFIFILCTCIIYIMSLDIFGFFSSTFVYLIIAMWGLKIKVKYASLVSVGFCIVIYLVFVTFLKVPVPRGMLI